MRLTRVRPLPPVTSTMQCMPLEAAKPTLTPAMVLTAFRTVALPAPRVQVQPSGRTLVNLATIAHTDAGPLVRTVTLLGQRVRLAIRPSDFAWSWGDGTTTHTSTAGAAYPSTAITHRYARAGDVHVQVAITWSATYRVDGGPSSSVPGTVSTTGQPVSLRVLEAVPALSGAGH